MIVYKKLFEVKIYHGFYDAYTAKDIDFVVPISTLKLLSMYSLIYKTTPEGFVVLYKEEKAPLLINIKEQIQFAFYLQIKDRHFGNYTLIDYKLNKEKFYFDNTGIEGANVDSKLISAETLHRDAFVSNNDRLDCVQPDSKLSSVFGNTEIIIEQGGEVLYDGLVTESQIASQTMGLNYGLYSVVVDGVRKELYYTPPCSPQMFGIVDLFLGGGNNLTLENVSKQAFEIRFDSRSVHWKYYVISNSGKTFDSIKIESGKNQIDFSEPKLSTLVNGKQASVVSSQEPIPLKKFYNGDKLFATISNSSSEFSGKRIRLPMPDINRVKGSVSSGNQKFFSEMYVYV